MKATKRTQIPLLKTPPPPEWVLITPEIAREFLARNRSNRPISRATVEKYKKDLIEKHWEVTHEGIGIDINGNMIDGQHRCTAIEETGIPALMIVARGLQPSAIHGINIGKRRSPGDFIRLALGDGYGKDEAAVARILFNLRNDRQPGCSEINNQVLGDEALRNREPILWARKYYAGGCYPMSVAGALAYAYPVNPKRADELAARLYSGANLRENSPELALSRYLARMRGKRSASAINEIVSHTLNATRHYLEGNPLDALKPAEEAFKYFRTKRRTLKID
jgi:hypothetical protein